MKKVIFLILLATVSYRTNSQYLIRKIDSLINLFEASKEFTIKINCDTMLPSHSKNVVSICSKLYSNGSFSKVVCRYDRFQLITGGLLDTEKTELKPGTFSIDIFYFQNDSLIKAIRKNFDFKPMTVTEYYFEGDDLRKLEALGLRSTDEYIHASDCIGLAYSFYRSILNQK